jgi:hypothetical protein
MFAQENLKKFKQLERKREILQMLSLAVGFGGIGGLTIFNPSILVTLPPLTWLLGELQTTSQRFLLMKELLENFKDEGIQIEVGLQIASDVRPIDLFLRFPDKEFILVQNRSLGNSKVFFNEKIEALQFIRKGGGLKKWEPDPLAELAVQEKTLRKTRRDLFGGSSKDQRRPLAKLLVLWNETRLGEHDEQTYDTIKENRFLTIRKIGTAAIVEKEQAVEFIRAYIAHRRSLRDSQNN